MTLSVAARKAEEHRLETIRERLNKESWNRLSNSEKVFHDRSQEGFTPQIANLEKEDEKKRAAMSRLMDLTNANSKAVIAANREKAMMHFAQHQGDTGSPEVQGCVPMVSYD